MCSSIGDGAAALVLTSANHARQRGLSGPRVRATIIESGTSGGDGLVVERAIARAYATAGIGFADLDLAEVHDAAAPAELMIGEQLGLVGANEGPKLIHDGISDLGGSCPINTSGGLLARGHAIGATGAAQLVELVDQLRGRSGDRQIDNAHIGIAENAGGSIGPGPAACAVTILEGEGR